MKNCYLKYICWIISIFCLSPLNLYANTFLEDHEENENKLITEMFYSSRVLFSLSSADVKSRGVVLSGISGAYLKRFSYFDFEAGLSYWSNEGDKLGVGYQRFKNEANEMYLKVAIPLYRNLLVDISVASKVSKISLRTSKNSDFIYKNSELGLVGQEMFTPVGIGLNLGVGCFGGSIERVVDSLDNEFIIGSIKYIIKY